MGDLGLSWCPTLGLSELCVYVCVRVCVCVNRFIFGVSGANCKFKIYR